MIVDEEGRVVAIGDIWNMLGDQIPSTDEEDWAAWDNLVELYGPDPSKWVERLLREMVEEIDRQMLAGLTEEQREEIAGSTKEMNRGELHTYNGG